MGVLYLYNNATSPAQSADYALRYHSLHDNQYLRYFRGHSGRITALAMSPKNDLFMSAAEARPQSYPLSCTSSSPDPYDSMLLTV